MKGKVRVAIAAIAEECNAFAPPTMRQDFHDHMFLEGEALISHFSNPEWDGFLHRLGELRQVDAIPILVAEAGSGGPCDAELFAEYLATIKQRLAAAMPLDGVYVPGHGAGITTTHDDFDGPLLAAVREVVGPSVPIIMMSDLHANISDLMIASADMIVTMKTNPHVDWCERSAHCADLMHRLMEGDRPHRFFCRLPLVTPQVSQLTAAGEPYGDLIHFAETLCDPDIADIAIWSGFALSDTSHNGLAIAVSAWSSPERADAIGRLLAAKAWAERKRYIRRLTPVDEAVDRAVACGRDERLPPVILADIADNPGGGARGNTMWILEALLHAGVRGCQTGLVFDPAVVADAEAAGEGGRFLARFNRSETNPFSLPLSAEARVLKLTDGSFIGARGMARNQKIRLGRSCLLEIGGIMVGVNSIRQQMLSSDYLAHFGLDPALARSFLVKSRGHFRAGFDQLVSPENVLEVSAPGLTTADLASVPWRRMTYPTYPLHPDHAWAPPMPGTAMLKQATASQPRDG